MTERDDSVHDIEDYGMLKHPIIVELTEVFDLSNPSL
jgi:hypothetical protein